MRYTFEIGTALALTKIFYITIAFLIWKLAYHYPKSKREKDAVRDLEIMKFLDTPIINTQNNPLLYNAY